VLNPTLYLGGLFPTAQFLWEELSIFKVWFFIPVGLVGRARFLLADNYRAGIYCLSFRRNALPKAYVPPYDHVY